MLPFVSWYRTLMRIAEAQRSAGVAGEANPILGFILYVIAVFSVPVEVIYAQDELNKLWRRAIPGYDRGANHPSATGEDRGLPVA